MAGLMEGRYPNLIVAGQLASITGEEAKHIRDSGLDGQYYRDLVLALIARHQPMSCEDIDQLLLSKLPEVLSDEQKRHKVRNLIQQLVRAELIRNSGSRGKPQWVLLDKKNW